MDEKAAPEATSTAESAEGELPLPTAGTFDYGGGLQEVTLVAAVEEYLAYHHLRKTFDAFRQDVDEVGLKRQPSRATSTIARDVEEVLCHFDAGRRDDFKENWARIMPEEFRQGDRGRSLELRLEAHFATLRARNVLLQGSEPDAADLKEDLEPFRIYLSEHALDEVCGDEALMPLFALPFVQRPHAQPNIGDVFQQKWLTELRSDIEGALRSRQPPAPLFYELMDMPPPGTTNEGSWQAVWAELLRVADAALDNASLMTIGAPVPATAVREGQKKLEQLRQHVPGGLEMKLSCENHHMGVASPSRGVRSRASTAAPKMPRDIDFRKLAAFLQSQTHLERRRSVSKSAQTKSGLGEKTQPLSAVLRAVLQRLASAEEPLAQRRGFLVAIACFDGLALRSSPETLPALLSDPSVNELTLGILAVLACDDIGRTYIVENMACVTKVVELLMTQAYDSALHIQALAALQRLSLRRGPQDKMIEMGIVEWVVSVLGWQEETIQGMPSEFSLEFGSAMLMNLALRTAGKRKCIKLDTLNVALNLMEHWNPQIRTHINGTLYSLLTVPSFRAKARQDGVDSILRSIHAHAGDDVTRRQLEYLLEQLNPPPEGAADNADVAESEEEDEDDDENFLEEEELAGVLLGDRSGQSAEEALRAFTPSASVAEANYSEFRAFLGRSAGSKTRL
eukprot:TRINITY_DN2129_c0_g1_i1.p1 TRINITY_DN2129_c0_g1~~TRINITY_DN2129_c0_g1_i1.p1  ORF type:complete len:681 (-),score=137.15 TRINITY_DN2129_c0_g1_i1:144-2186(-)